MNKKQKRILGMIAIAFLVVVIPLLIFLVRQQQNLKSKASINGTGAEFVAANGASLPVGADGIPETTDRNVKINLQYVPGSSPNVCNPACATGAACVNGQCVPVVPPSPSPPQVLAGSCSMFLFVVDPRTNVDITDGMNLGRYSYNGSSYIFNATGSIPGFTVSGTSTYRMQIWATSNTASGQPMKMTEGSSAFPGQTSAGADIGLSDLTQFLRLGQGSLECRLINSADVIVGRRSYSVNVTNN